jgi:hypothetical protein
MRPFALFLCVFAVGCGAAEQPHTATKQRTATPASEWTVKVTVASPAAGPITVTAVHLRPAPAGVNSHPWIQHDLVFRNDGEMPVTFADTRTSRFLGARPRLLAGDEGCGYEKRTARIIPGACLSYLDAFTVRPHGAVKRTVTLFKELAGMQRLAAGTYIFDRPIRFSFGTTPPDAGEGRSVVLRVRYAISRAA